MSQFYSRFLFSHSVLLPFYSSFYSPFILLYTPHVIQAPNALAIVLLFQYKTSPYKTRVLLSRFDGVTNTLWCQFVNVYIVKKIASSAFPVSGGPANKTPSTKIHDFPLKFPETHFFILISDTQMWVYLKVHAKLSRHSE